jgi:hypothetical protein
MVTNPSVRSCIASTVCASFNVLSYVTDSLVGAWTRAITGSTTATLYSGRYVSTDGSTDKLFYDGTNGIDLTAAGALTEITFKGRAATGAVFRFNLSSGVVVTSTQVGNNVWEDHTIVVDSEIADDFYAYTTTDAGDWSDVRATGATHSPHWPLTESSAADLDGKPAFDSSGNGFHGAHIGCAGGTGETTILQTAGMNWNKRCYFEGSDLSGDSITINETFGNTDTITFKLTDIPNAEGHILASSGAGNRISIGGGALRIQIQNNAVAPDLGVTDSLEHTIAVERSGAALTIKVDGVQVAQYLSYPTFEPIFIQIGSKNFTTSIPYFRGILSDVNFSDGGFYEGHGNTTADWGATVASAPSEILIPPSDTTPTEDALGNAIANPRINAQVFNGFDSDQYLLLPDDSSLESVSSVTLAIYNDGGTKDILVAAGGASFADIAGGTLQSDQTTSATYVNGEATTTLAAGWNIVSLVFDAGKDLSAGKLQFVAGSLLAYGDKALTAQEVAQNHNYFASSYGLAKVDIPEVPEVPEGTVFTSTSDVETTVSIVGTLEEADVPSNTKSVVVGTDVTAIGDYAFYEQPLETVHIHDGVTSFGAGVFDRETPITIEEFTFPSNLASVGGDCFRNFRMLSLTMRAEQAKLVGDGAGGIPFVLNDLTFKDGSVAIPNAGNFDNGLGGQPLTGTITIPTSLTTIGWEAFKNCQFTQFTIPNHITAVGIYAFYLCAELTTINCYVAKSVVDKEGVFLDTGVTTIHVRSDDTSWTAGGGQTIGDKSGITVIKDL